MSPKVWLITGTSSGFGSLLVKAALQHGDKVIATARDASKIEDLKALGAATLALDVVDDDETIKRVVADAVAVYGRIDILVNNAAYILAGAVEESSAAEVAKIFNTNVFGPLTVIRAVLPYMRAQRSGVVANMGSAAGWQCAAGVSLYCSTKYAIAAISESLRLELQPLGIDALVIEPGYFRTNFLAAGHRAPTAVHIADYDAVMEPLRAMLGAFDQKQPGDPLKGARVIVEILTKTGRAAGKTLPARLPLGSDAVATIAETCRAALEVVDEWRDIASSTDHDDVERQ